VFVCTDTFAKIYYTFNINKQKEFKNKQKEFKNKQKEWHPTTKHFKK
jgi:hypothetical protein